MIFAGYIVKRVALPLLAWGSLCKTEALASAGFENVITLAPPPQVTYDLR